MRDDKKREELEKELLAEAFDECMDEQLSFIPSEREIARMHRYSEDFQQNMQELLDAGGKPKRKKNTITQREFVYSFNKIAACILAVLVVGVSLLLSRMFGRRISRLLQAIRTVREGSYSHRAQIRGTDEIGQIAAEFNSLTDRLQTTEEARRRFVSDASHEMKTPLAGIKLLTDSILQTENIDPATTREFVSDIGAEASRLERITEDLLRLTRLDSGAVEPAVCVAVKPVLERAARMLQPVAGQREVELTCRADEAAAVRATEGDVHQILYNLMENGVKYTAPGGFVHTSVSVEEGRVVITVSDNGIGIPVEDMPHIFERFYRVDKARSRQIGGTGLGLSIVGDTVQRRGGEIGVAPREGGGTVFTVSFPQAEPEVTA